MSTTISMPQLGETVTEGTILRWAKQVGDEIAEDEVLVEISTDKVDTEVPSPASGTILELLVGEGDTVEVGTAIAVIGEADEAGVETTTEPAGEEPAPAAVAEESSQPETAPEETPEVAPETPVEEEPAPAAEAEEEPSLATEEVPTAPTPDGESTTISMPQLGETVTEGTILRWAKQVGDEIAEDEVLVEISTDKVDTEVPSPASGTILELLVGEGDTVEVGTAIAVIGASGAVTAPTEEAPAPVAEEAEAPAETETVAEQPEPTAQPVVEAEVATATAPASGGDGAGLLLSPVVRKLMRENDLDPTAIVGTGRGGRITRGDVEAVIEAGGTPAPPAEELPAAATAPTVAEPVEGAEPTGAVAAPPAAAEAKPAPGQKIVVPEGSEEVDLDRLRVRIGENLIRAKQTAAHVWASIEVDFERVERVRQSHKDAFKTEEGFSLTYLPFVARAVIDALHEYPIVNSSFYLEQKKAVMHHSVNLGIAVDVDQKALVVPVIKNAADLRLVGLARQVRDLAAKAREGRLEPDDLAGSTFSITNPGPFGTYQTAPIINVPNTAILSTDTVTKRATVIEGPDGGDLIAIHHIGYLGLSWDHRAFDGAPAALFLKRIKENLETWDWEQELA